MNNNLTGVLIALITISCSKKRVLIDELVDKRERSNVTYFYQGEHFNGVAFDIHNGTGDLKQVFSLKDGVRIY
ncbi:hypothetical protein N8768_05380 [Flavobacteriaceae bacterium]|nr:hypothetical protein [Flavobacteriaceae bacterium]